MTDGKPDEVDLRILDLLQRDASLEVSRLSALVCRSSSSVHERIKKLKAAGLIKSTVAILDRELVGLPVLVIVQVKLEKPNRESLCRHIEAFRSLPEVQCCLHVSGTWDFILHVVAATPAAYYDFLMAHICGQPTVRQVESSFVMAECKGFGALPLQGGILPQL